MDVRPLISKKAKLVLEVALTANVPKYTKISKLSDIFVHDKFKLEGNVVNVSAKIVTIDPIDHYYLIKIEDSTGKGLLCVKNAIAQKLEISRVYSFLFLRYTIVDNLLVLKTISDSIIVKHNI